MTDNGPTFLTVPEVALRLQLKPDTVRNLIRAGVIRAIDVRNPRSRRAVFRVPLDALNELGQSRPGAIPKTNNHRRRRKPKLDVIEFYK